MWRKHQPASPGPDLLTAYHHLTLKQYFAAYEFAMNAAGDGKIPPEWSANTQTSFAAEVQEVLKICREKMGQRGEPEASTKVD